MEPISMIIGILGIVISLLLIGWYLGEAVPLKGLGVEFDGVREWVNKHDWLKVLFGIFSLYLLLFIPRIMWENDTNVCEVVQTQSALVSVNVTNYTYSHVCFSTTNTMGHSVFMLYTKLLWLVGIYGLIVMLLVMVNKILEWGKGL